MFTITWRNNYSISSKAKDTHPFDSEILLLGIDWQNLACAQGDLYKKLY